MGELKKLNVKLPSRNTVKNILKRHGLASMRGQPGGLPEAACPQPLAMRFSQQTSPELAWDPGSVCADVSARRNAASDRQSADVPTGHSLGERPIE